MSKLLRLNWIRCLLFIVLRSSTSSLLQQLTFSYPFIYVSDYVMTVSSPTFSHMNVPKYNLLL
jgi:hypothetical protein